MIIIHLFPFLIIYIIGIFTFSYQSFIVIWNIRLSTYPNSRFGFSPLSVLRAIEKEASSKCTGFAVPPLLKSFPSERGQLWPKQDRKKILIKDIQKIDIHDNAKE